VIIFLIILLSAYAYLPENTSLYIDDIVVSKAVFFYSTLIIFCLINFLFSTLGWLYKKAKTNDLKKTNIREWLLSLPVPINFYLIFIVAYIGVINNSQSTDADSYFYLLYLGPVLVVVWVLAFAKILVSAGANTE